LVLFSLPLTPLTAELSVSFGEKDITARGVGKGGTVALLGVAKTPRLYYSETTYVRELLVDRDADGVVTYQLDAAVPGRSLWAFVDLETGERTIAAPEEDAGREAAFPLEDSLRDDLGDSYTLVADRRAALEILYVRPRDGTWHAAATDGGPTDRDDSDDGRVKIYLEDLEDLSGGKRQLLEVVSGDVIVGIDPHLGEYFALEIQPADVR
jgi:hypothetical protein